MNTNFLGLTLSGGAAGAAAGALGPRPLRGNPSAGWSGAGGEDHWRGTAAAALAGKRLGPASQSRSWQTGAGGAVAQGNHADDRGDSAEIADGQPKRHQPQNSSMEKGP